MNIILYLIGIILFFGFLLALAFFSFIRGVEFGLKEAEKISGPEILELKNRIATMQVTQAQNFMGRSDL